MTGAQIVDFYRTHAERIFPQRTGCLTWFADLSGPRYSREDLTASLKEVFGARVLSDSKVRLVIPSYDRERNKIYVFKTPHLERVKTDPGRSFVDVGVATASAPTFFPSQELRDGTSLIDGGIWANNPVAVAVAEAIGNLGWKRESLYVLSVGSTEAVRETPRSFSRLKFSLSGSELLFCAQSSGAIGLAETLLGSPDRILRVQQHVAAGVFALDKAAAINRLEGMGSSLARDYLDTVDQMFLGSKATPYF